jgi:hypothetical protein
MAEDLLRDRNLGVLIGKKQRDSNLVAVFDSKSDRERIAGDFSESASKMSSTRIE